LIMWWWSGEIWRSCHCKVRLLERRWGILRHENEREVNWKNLTVRNNRFIYSRTRGSHGGGWKLRWWDGLSADTIV